MLPEIQKEIEQLQKKQEQLQLERKKLEERSKRIRWRSIRKFVEKAEKIGFDVMDTPAMAGALSIILKEHRVEEAREEGLQLFEQVSSEHAMSTAVTEGMMVHD